MGEFIHIVVPIQKLWQLVYVPVSLVLFVSKLNVLILIELLYFVYFLFVKPTFAMYKKCEIETLPIETLFCDILYKENFWTLVKI